MQPLQHNIVSILYSILGFAEAHLERGREGGFAGLAERLEHAEAVLGKVFHQAGRALKIMKELNLMYQRGRTPGTCVASTSVGEAWRRVLRRLKARFPFAGIEVIEHVPTSFPPIRCVAADFENILFTLAQNALQAMKGGGKLVIRAELAYTTQEEPFVVIQVADTGPGIEGEKLTCLFQPFFTTKGDGEGTGLGLFLVRELVGRNGGKVLVSSFEGCGTTFTLEFGLAKAVSGDPGAFSPLRNS